MHCRVCNLNAAHTIFLNTWLCPSVTEFNGVEQVTRHRRNHRATLPLLPVLLMLIKGIKEIIRYYIFAHQMIKNCSYNGNKFGRYEKLFLIYLPDLYHSLQRLHEYASDGGQQPGMKLYNTALFSK